MSKMSRVLLGLTLVAVAAAGVQASWVEYVDQTATRLDAPSSLVLTDSQEKEYAWNDIDKDGDIDLVIVRKQPFTSAGKFRNVLLINEDGVLTDRTDDFAVAADVPGDQGFLTPTNDRDVILVDVDLDGWLDMVTATTISFGDPKHIGHPRVYMNQCCAVGGCEAETCTTENWLGFEFQNSRIPQMLTWAGENNQNPCFCSVRAGDVTGDGYPELYFGAYDSGGTGGSQCAAKDFNDKLLLNAGSPNPGFFTDVTTSRFDGIVPLTTQPFPVSAFGAADEIVDLNGDGHLDIVKQTSLTTPEYVGTAFNDPSNLGFFDEDHYDNYDSLYSMEPYFVSAGDLNKDNRLDLVITDDGQDRYLLNPGGSMPNFNDLAFDYDHQGSGVGDSSDQGFGSDSVIADLDKDGWNDVLIADVDVDISGCNRRTSIYRNLGGPVGGTVTLQEITTGFSCSVGNQSTCLVASIPADKLKGTHDIAVFDINGDTWLDLVVGRCNSTEIYVNVPPGGPSGAIGDDSSSYLLADRTPGSTEITLSWGASCVLDDTQYSVYEGRIAAGSFEDHGPVACDIGATTLTFVPDVQNTYYLVVPNNGLTEGAYGKASSGLPRSPSPSACHPQNPGACD